MQTSRFLNGDRRSHALVPGRTDRWKEVTSVPGVQLGGQGIRVPWDAVSIIEKILGRKARPHKWLEEYPGAARYRSLDLKNRLWKTQRLDARWLATRSYGVLVVPPRCGKTYSAIAGAIVSGASEDYRGIIVTKAQLRLHWVDVIQDLTHGDKVLLLYGRSGEKARWVGDHFYLYGDAYDRALREARWVVLNYDILIPQAIIDAAGVAYNRDDLPGHARSIRQAGFAFGIGDEIHRVGPWSRNEARKNDNRRARLRHAWMGLQQAWGLTATPEAGGHFRSWWGVLDVLSGGQWTDYKGGTPFTFHKRYCNGRKVAVEGISGVETWVADGMTRLPEFNERARYWRKERTEAEVRPHMPDKIRIVRRIECADNLIQVQGSKQESAFMRMRSLALTRIMPGLIEAVLENMLQGTCKTIIFTVHPVSAERIAAALKKQLAKRGIASKYPGANVWCATGKMGGDLRARMAHNFREHCDPGAFVMTMRALGEGLSFRGADFTHFAELDTSPDVMEQAENRANEERSTGLPIYYWIAENSYAERAIEILLPKIEMLVAARKSKTASEMMILRQEMQDSREEIWAAITGGVRI